METGQRHLETFASIVFIELLIDTLPSYTGGNY